MNYSIRYLYIDEYNTPLYVGFTKCKNKVQYLMCHHKMGHFKYLSGVSIIIFMHPSENLLINLFKPLYNKISGKQDGFNISYSLTKNTKDDNLLVNGDSILFKKSDKFDHYNDSLDWLDLKCNVDYYREHIIIDMYCYYNNIPKLTYPKVEFFKIINICTKKLKAFKIIDNLYELFESKYHTNYVMTINDIDFNVKKVMYMIIIYILLNHKLLDIEKFNNREFRINYGIEYYKFPDRIMINNIFFNIMCSTVGFLEHGTCGG